MFNSDLDVISRLGFPQTAERVRAAAKMVWRPVETIPRDGREVLVYRPLAYKTNDPVVMIAKTETENRWCWPDTVPDESEPTNPTDRSCHVTHWMPLPEAP